MRRELQEQQKEPQEPQEPQEELSSSSSASPSASSFLSSSSASSCSSTFWNCRSGRLLTLLLTPLTLPASLMIGLCSGGDGEGGGGGDGSSGGGGDGRNGGGDDDERGGQGCAASCSGCRPPGSWRTVCEGATRSPRGAAGPPKKRRSAHRMIAAMDSSSRWRIAPLGQRKVWRALVVEVEPTVVVPPGGRSRGSGAPWW